MAEELENPEVEMPKTEELEQKNEKAEQKEDSSKADIQYRLNKKLEMLNVVGVFHDKNSGGILLGVTSKGEAKLINRYDADFILSCMSAVSPSKDSYAVGDESDGTVKELDQTKKNELDEKGDRIQESEQKRNAEHTENKGNGTEEVKKDVEASKDFGGKGNVLGWKGPAAVIMKDVLSGRPLPKSLQTELREVCTRAVKNFNKDISNTLNRDSSLLNKYMGGRITEVSGLNFNI